MLRLAQATNIGMAEPLQTLTVTGADGATVAVRDGVGREYARMPIVDGEAMFTVGGALGTHTVEVCDEAGQMTGELSFAVDAQTQLDDNGGQWHELFEMLKHGLGVPRSVDVTTVTWRGRTYTCFVHWLLDHLHTAKGMQYFSPYASDLAELLRDSQREDGMIWSFVINDDGPGYFDTAYGPFGYMRRDGNTLFVRQPAENHVEYLYANLIYLCWSATGDDAWMAGMLDSACQALEYSVTDRSRWSEEFGLLKRGYTIDSGDVQVQDEHSPQLGLGNDMLIDPDKTKFGIFYGDNTGYIQACEQLAAMLTRAGRAEDAETYRRRGEDLRDRIDILAWNGEFFTHRIEEDPNLHRDLGVDPLAQISQSNCYSVNRVLTHGQCRAIIETYQTLQENLPPGSPGEWYSIYPPFERGFGGQWVSLNGGVAGHAAGELARGAFEHGYEDYGVDILKRLLGLGQAHGGHLWFSYPGAIIPEALFWRSETQPGNDLRGLPVGASDNLASGTAMAALVEGLAGVRDLGSAYRHVRLSPRWDAAGTASAAVTVRYAASDGYVAYTYTHDEAARRLLVALTGSGDEIHCRLLLPNGAASVSSVTLEDRPLAFEVSAVDDSMYAEFTVTLPMPQTVAVKYGIC